MYLKKTYTAGITKEVHNTYSCLLYTSGALLKHLVGVTFVIGQSVKFINNDLV